MHTAQLDYTDIDYAADLTIECDQLRAALAELVQRCDGAEGVRSDGSNIDTIAAHAALGHFEDNQSCRSQCGPPPPAARAHRQADCEVVVSTPPDPIIDDIDALADRIGKAMSDGAWMYMLADALDEACAVPHSGPIYSDAMKIRAQRCRELREAVANWDTALVGDIVCRAIERRLQAIAEETI